MIDTLTIAYERTDEAKSTRENNLNREYEHLFAHRNESITQIFIILNFLYNDMRRFDIIKHEVVLVLNFIDSFSDKWEHLVDVFKNNEKIKSMDLQSLYGNLRNFKGKKIMCKKIMQDSFKGKSFALFIKKSNFTPNSDNDKYDNVDSEEEYYVELVSSKAMIIKHYGYKKFGHQRNFVSKFNSSTIKRTGTRSLKKFFAEKND